jgi:hypothetical protein
MGVHGLTRYFSNRDATSINFPKFSMFVVAGNFWNKALAQKGCGKS